MTYNNNLKIKNECLEAQQVKTVNPLANIPIAIRNENRFCLAGKEGKGKIFAVKNGARVSANKGGWDAALKDGRLKTYNEVMADMMSPIARDFVLLDKIGYLPSAQYVILDFDPIEKDGKKEERPAARTVVNKAKDKTYIEKSSSGCGFHIIYSLAEGQTILGGKRNIELNIDDDVFDVEVFCGNELNNYVLLTGSVLGTMNIAPLPEEMYKLINEHGPVFHFNAGELEKDTGNETITERYFKRRHVTDYLRPTNEIRQPDGSLQGAHPIHGSKTGINLSVNKNDNEWHCFRCDSGGGVFEAWAVSRGIIDCSEAKKGWFSSLAKEKQQMVFELLEKEFPESREDEIKAIQAATFVKYEPNQESKKWNVDYEDLKHKKKLHLKIRKELGDITTMDAFAKLLNTQRVGGDDKCGYRYKSTDETTAYTYDGKYCTIRGKIANIPIHGLNLSHVYAISMLGRETNTDKEVLYQTTWYHFNEEKKLDDRQNEDKAETTIPDDKIMRNEIYSALEYTMRYDKSIQKWRKINDSNLWEEVDEKTAYDVLEEKMDELLYKYQQEEELNEKEFRKRITKLHSNSWMKQMMNMCKELLAYEFGSYPEDAELILHNGILLKDGSLRERKCEDFITEVMCVPTKYKPELLKMPAPEIVEKFLDEISRCPSHRKGDKEWKETLLNTIAYCVIKGNPKQKIFWWVGTGGNGKGVFLDFIVSIFGSGIIQQISADELQVGKGSGRQDTLAQAVSSSRIMVVAEDTGIGGTKMDDGIIKAITGDKKATLRRIYEPAKNYEVNATPIMITNKSPMFTEGGKSIARRSVIIKFEMDIDDYADIKRDDALSDKLEEEDCREWMFAAIVGRMLEYNKTKELTICPRVKESTQDALMRGDDVRAFIEECIQKQEGQIIKRESVFEKYLTWRDGEMENWSMPQGG